MRILSRLVVAAAFSGLFAGSTYSIENKFGKFVGEPVTKWDDDGRMMITTKPFGFVGSDGVEWAVPPNFATDGASIPGFAWSFIGGPFEGRFRKAALIHDLYCATKSRSASDVHKVFYDASLAAGESKGRTWVMYQAILRFGPTWDKVASRDDKCNKYDSVSAELCTVNTLASKAVKPTRKDIEALAAEARAQGYTDEADELNKVANEY